VTGGAEEGRQMTGGAEAGRSGKPDAQGACPRNPSERGALTYRSAGVDVEAGEEAVRLIKKDVESTYIPGVMGSLGGFAGLFELPKGLEDPVLVSGTDGVGTKILLAQETGRLDTVGIDLVAMSVNDVLTVGARPLFFLDYVAVGRLVPAEMAQLVAGVAEGCRQAGCALVGGEMAEMSGLYAPGEFDLAGFCVALAERKKLVDGSRITAGDVVLGLASTGVHSNGFSLVRKVLEKGGASLSDPLPGFVEPAAETLLTPTRIYVRSVLGLLEKGVPIRGMAHVTGGGIAGNLGRVIPGGLSARIHRGTWKVPPVFAALQALGGLSEAEMFLAFNMGLGYLLVVPGAAAERALTLLQAAGEEATVVGEIAPGGERVVLDGPR
jgi:phosphoribosylformylglycinamidine cyclo-ligase